MPKNALEWGKFGYWNLCHCKDWYQNYRIFTPAEWWADPWVTCSWLTIRVGNCPDDKCKYVFFIHSHIHIQYLLCGIFFPSILSTYSKSLYLIPVCIRKKKTFVQSLTGPILSEHKKFDFFLVNIIIWSIKYKYICAKRWSNK